MTIAAVSLFAALLFMLVVGFVVLTTFNTVVALQRRVERALANVEVALQQRHDELPKVVAAVRGQLGFERDVMDQVTRLRAAWSPTAPLREQAMVADATSLFLRSVSAVVEDYPTLRSQENVLALQEEIERLETVIAGRRELHNEQVYHNATIEQVPAVFMAGLFGWRPRASFEADQSSRIRPEAHLSTG